MSYAERIRHPNEVLNPPPEKPQSANMRWYIAAAIAVLILAAIFRPQRLAKMAMKVPNGGRSPNGIANPHGWM